MTAPLTTTPAETATATVAEPRDAKAQLFNHSFMADTLFWTGLSFAVLLYIMWKKVVPAVAETLDKRAARIREDLDRAALLHSEARQALTAYEKQVKTARQEAHDIIQAARGDAERLIAKRTAEVERELSRRAEEARLNIERAKTEALQEVKTHIAELTMLATEKLIREKVDAARANALTDDAIKKMMH